MSHHEPAAEQLAELNRAQWVAASLNAGTIPEAEERTATSARPEQAPQTETPLGSRRLYWLVMLAGLAVIAQTAFQWNSTDLIKFVIFTTFTLLVSSSRIVSPTGATGLPVTFVLVLFGVANFAPSEAVIVAAASAWLHAVRVKRKHEENVSPLFELMLSVIAAETAYRAYYSPAISGAEFDLFLRFGAATMAIALITTTGQALMSALRSGDEFLRTWIDEYLWRLSYYFGGGIVAAAMTLASTYLGWQTVLLSGPVVYLIYRSYYHYVTRLEAEKRHAEEMSDVHMRAIEALALAIEAKDTTTGVHLQRVQIYAQEIGKELGLSELDLQALWAASLLHDIGKLAVPEHIISKPGRLTPEEFEKMKIHPIVGAEILERVRFPYPVVPIVRAHHEKWDGTGYPMGLSGEDIPIGARILAAVDCLDALASDRQYRRAMPIEQALDIVRGEAGKAFDPQVVEVLCTRFEELERKTRKPNLRASQLSTDIKVELGEAPAAGFEHAEPDSSEKGERSSPYVNSIASARQEVQTLFEISQDLGNSLSLDETLSVLNIRLRRIIPHHLLAIWLRRGNVLEPVYVNGEECRLFSTLRVPVGQGLSGWVAQNSKPIVNGSPNVEPAYLQDAKIRSSLRSALAVPLENSQGDVVGVISLYNLEPDAFTRDHLRIMAAISPKIGVSIENSLKFQQVESSATTDYLTSLPNARSLFLQLEAEIQRARRTQMPLAIAVLDMDGLKQINDQLGHMEGNRILSEVAQGLKGACREYDYVARMGGDEFVLLLPGLGKGEVGPRVDHLRHVIGNVGRLAALENPLSASLGVAHFPADANNPQELLQIADRRMYQEKRLQKTSRNLEPQTNWAEELTSINFR